MARIAEKLASKDYKINQYISLKLERGKIFIYLNEKRFIICKALFMHFPTQEYNLNLGSSIDTISEVSEYKEDIIDITPEQEFWGHCSNIQAWVENDYDTRLLHRSLAFPLLRKLALLGDPKAITKYKEELIKRLAEGHPNTIKFIVFNHYHRILDHDEFLSAVLRSKDFKVLKSLEKLTGEEFRFDDQTDEEELRYKLLFDVEYGHIVKLRIHLKKLTKIPESIRKLEKIRILDLNYNEIDDIPHWIREMDSLEVLNLLSNEINLLDNIYLPKNLKLLDLSLNWVKKVDDLPPTIAKSSDYEFIIKFDDFLIKSIN